MLRSCDACWQSDEHPHHVHGLPNGSTQSRHMDCCAAAGCPDGSCLEVLARTPERGVALREYLTAGSVDSLGDSLNEARVAAAGSEA
jgi:hypothetical protein